MASTLSFASHNLPHITIPPPTARGSRLRDVVATGAFNKHMDSSEAFPSEHGSICNAFLVSYEADEDEVKRLSKDILLANVSNSRSQAFALGAKCEPANPSTNPLGPNSPSMKVYAYDDLDMPRALPKFNPTPSRQNSRSASSEGFQPASWLNEVPSPVEPRLPVFPPPVRSPTPPGLPSFGSLDAMSYVSRRSRKDGTRNGRSRRGDKKRRNNTRNGDNENDFLTGFFTGLGRILGLVPAVGPRSQRLPPGIVARAEDGTYIRARFGNRQSGHGVGAGPASVGLASHPFHRSSLPTATTASGVDTNAINRRRPVYSNPPYRSLLDVPPAPQIPDKEPNNTSRGIPEPPAPNPAFHSADTRRGHFEPHLSNIRENTRSPPRAPPGGYSAPVNMGLSMDGRGDDPSPPDGHEAPLSPTSRVEERLVGGEFENDESYCCCCIPGKKISSFFTKATRACRTGCCGLSLEEQHAGNPALRDHVNASTNICTGEQRTAHNTRRNIRQEPANTPAAHSDDDHAYDADTNTESETDSSSTVRANIPTSNAQSNRGGGPSSQPQPTGRRESSSRSSPFVPMGWPASVIYRYSTSSD